MVVNESIVFHIAALYIVFRYMHCFFDVMRAKKGTGLAAYVLYLCAVCLVEMLPMPGLAAFAADVFLLYLLAQIYHGKQGKKLLAASLVQGMNLFLSLIHI